MKSWVFIPYKLKGKGAEMDYSVTYIGQIVESKRPSGFPQKISTVGMYRVENTEELKGIINNEFAVLLKNQGMIVNLNPSEVVDTTKIMQDDRVFVPMHMIAYIYTLVKKIQGDVPMLFDGKFVDSKGKEVQIQ